MMNSNNKFRRCLPTYAVVALVCLLGACAGNPYKPPTAGPTASIEFANESATDGMALHFYDDAAECSGRGYYPKGVPHGEHPVLTVAAGKEAAFSLIMKKENVADNSRAGYAFGPIGLLVAAEASASAYCMPTFSFTPAVNGAYIVRMNTVGGACNFSLEAKPAADAPPGPEAQQVPYAMREWTRGMTESSAWCKKR